MYKTCDLFDLRRTLAGEYLSAFPYPWQALEGISDFICALGQSLGEEFAEIAPMVWVHSTAKIAPTAFLGAPCVIGANTEVRHCAFIRGCVLVGDNCVVGNSVELKNAILFDCVQVPHFNYVGDSILGFCAHMGAGSVTSNVKSDKSAVVVKGKNEEIPTNLPKCGAMVGDFAEIGCNAVLNPCTVLGKNVTVYPTSCVRGTVPENHIWKNNGQIAAKK